MPRSRKNEPVKPKDPARAPSIRGEKRVKKTAATVPVGAARRARGTHDGPTDPAAIDRRLEITGTDELRKPDQGKQPRPRGGGGNAGRPAVARPGRS